MDTRIADLPDLRLIGHAARVPLIHEGVNPHIQAHIASLPADEHLRLKALSSAEPAGLLQVSADVEPDYTEGSELTYLHGVAVAEGTTVPGDLDVIAVPAGSWAVFRTSGPYPRRPAVHVGRDRHRLVPLEPVAVAAGALDGGHPRPCRGLQHRDVRAVAAGGTRLASAATGRARRHARDVAGATPRARRQRQNAASCPASARPCS